MDLARRIAVICAEQRISTKALADLSGIAPQTLYDIRAGKIKTITAEKAAGIHKAFPQYSVEWLVLGENSKGENEHSTDKCAELAERIERIESEMQNLRALVEQIANKYGIKVPQQRKRGRPAKQQSENK